MNCAWHNSDGFIVVALQLHSYAQDKERKKPEYKRNIIRTVPFNKHHQCENTVCDEHFRCEFVSTERSEKKNKSFHRKERKLVFFSPSLLAIVNSASASIQLFECVCVCEVRAAKAPVIFHFNLCTLRVPFASIKLRI